MITLSSITAAGSAARANEDTFFIRQDERMVIVAVMDGVTQMLTSPALDAICTYQGRTLTPGGFAAAVTRDTFARLFSAAPAASLRDALNAANVGIRRRVTETIGDCSLAAFQTADPRLAVLGDDPRAVRVVLPAAVVTLARLDLASGEMECAHLGDTALLHFPADGPSSAVTRHPRHVVPDPTYARLRELPLDADFFPADYAHMTPHDLTHDMAGRFYHNYADAAGNAHQEIGIGVLDGLPEMASYIRAYRLALAPGDAVLLCSDGFLWPRQPFADFMLAGMGTSIAANGLAGYLAEVRAEERRIAALDQSPRLKVHDDATATELRYLG